MVVPAERAAVFIEAAHRAPVAVDAGAAVAVVTWVSVAVVHVFFVGGGAYGGTLHVDVGVAVAVVDKVVSDGSVVGYLSHAAGGIQTLAIEAGIRR